MADNYLERRMEELRSGKLSVKKAIPGIRAKAKRIVVAGGCHGAALEKALEYRRDGYRVAIFDEEEATGKRLAHDYGVRFHRVALSDEDALKIEIEKLLATWRGVDRITGSADICVLLSKQITYWKENLPIADKSSLEVVII